MRYLTTTAAAAVLAVDPSRVRLLCQRGRIKTIKIGNAYAISDRELARFAAIPRRAGRPRRGQTAFPQTATKMPFQQGVLPSQQPHLPTCLAHPENLRRQAYLDMDIEISGSAVRMQSLLWQGGLSGRVSALPKARRRLGTDANNESPRSGNGSPFWRGM